MGVKQRIGEARLKSRSLFEVPRVTNEHCAGLNDPLGRGVPAAIVDAYDAGELARDASQHGMEHADLVVDRNKNGSPDASVGG